MSPAPTPRATSARRINHLDPSLPRYVVPVELAEELERELAATKEQAERLAGALKEAARALNVAAGRIGCRVRPTSPHGQLITPHPWEDEAMRACFKASEELAAWEEGRA